MTVARRFRRAAAADLENVPDPALAAKKTWRYLRLAMVGMVVGLAASILYEHAQTSDGCWQGSISAYYYTPVQGFLVGALVTIGVCLFSLKGNTDWEDALLNLAGVCAPFVALVPTPNIGSCGSVLTDTTHRDVNIANNVVALLVLIWLGLALLVGLAIAGHRRDRTRPTWVELAGFVGSLAAIVGATVVFIGGREWFTDNGHDVAAIAMFVFIFLTVCLNARHLYVSRRRGPRPARALNRYTVVALLMGVTVVVNGLLALAGWAFWALSIEASLITLFGYFWLLQTIELWNQGLRARSPEVAQSSAA
jgi:hypothetical protein